MTLRELSDRRMQLVADPDRDELDQPVTRLVEHAERAVRGTHRLGRGLDDRVQDGVQVEVGPDREDRVEQPFELPVDFGRLAGRLAGHRCVPPGQRTRQVPGAS